ncbi:hypothetical protein Clacol_008653 [Clathrus columnatus]|uniref:Uncharacterized protein n=1 Tax=Clathrus columnatus TaxID=1419009 RepID=A0AAV5AMN9_9AGAM|nr:hypothetical protein Clacol_008653 [Clathrus columnatus]
MTCGTKNSACLCTPAVRQSAIDCVDCVAAVLPSTLQTLQSAADQSVIQCQEEGHPIDPVTIVAAQSGVTPTNPPAAAPPPTASNSPTSGSSSTAPTPAKSNAYALSGYLHPFFITLSVASVFFLGVY